MIEILTPAASATPAMIDYGGTMPGAAGARDLRLDRPGNKYKIEVTWPRMRPDAARELISDLIAGQSEGVRVRYPLMGVSQGVPGSPVVDGSGQAGKTLAIRGLTPGYAFRRGFWLTLIDDVAAGDALGDELRYLHHCRSALAANADGEATIVLAEALRTPFADGATILLARPTIEGLPEGNERSWVLPGERLVQLTVPIREIA
jgi:hypothetical protein